MNEIWKDVPGYGNHYQASNFGRVKSKDRVVERKHSTGCMAKFFYKGKVLNPSRSDKYGHLSVHISVNNKKQNVFVHKFVLLAFVGECPIGMECCHNNGIADDNRVENLRWDTHFANNQDRKLHGKYKEKECHPMAKLTLEQVIEIKKSKQKTSDLVKTYNISKSQVCRIRSNHAWTL
jgi:hypothetical protein